MVSLGCWNRQSKVGRLGIGYSKSSSGLWDIRAVPSCLVSGSGVSRWAAAGSVKGPAEDVVGVFPDLLVCI